MEKYFFYKRKNKIKLSYLCYNLLVLYFVLGKIFSSNLYFIVVLGSKSKRH